jgi:gliding motility-associated-like protein
LARFDNTSNAPAGTSFEWNLGDNSAVQTTTDVTHSYTDEGTYTVTLRADFSTCTVTETLQVQVVQQGVYVPSAFTPDGDGVNDLLNVQVAPNATTQMAVFDRWGVEVASLNDDSWNGKNSNGAQVPEGVYVVLVKVTYPDGTVLERTQAVTVVR